MASQVAVGLRQQRVWWWPVLGLLAVLAQWVLPGSAAWPVVGRS